eukprot:UN25346
MYFLFILFLFCFFVPIESSFLIVCSSIFSSNSLLFMIIKYVESGLSGSMYDLMTFSEELFPMVCIPVFSFTLSFRFFLLFFIFGVWNINFFVILHIIVNSVIL